MAWDVKVWCPLAESYVEAAARELGEAAEIAAARKSTKYTELDDLKAPFTRYNLLSNRLSNPFNNNGLSNPFDSRFDNWMFVYTIQPVVKQVVQPV